MTKFPEADARLFKNKFVCRKCKSVMRSTPRSVADGKLTCRTCAGKAFKPKRKK